MLSPYCLEIKNKNDIKSRDINKLTPQKRTMLLIIEIYNIIYDKD